MGQGLSPGPYVGKCSTSELYLPQLLQLQGWANLFKLWQVRDLILLGVSLSIKTGLGRQGQGSLCLTV